MLRDAFRVLDRADVGWCVLRGERDLARPTGDVDLLISPSDCERARIGLRAVGFARLSACGCGSHSFLRAYHRPTDDWITLDIVTDLSYGPAFCLATGAELGCLRRRRRAGEVSVLAPDDAFWTLLFHCMLDKRGFEAHHASRLQALADLALPDGPLASLVAALSSPAWPPRRILRAARSADWESLAAMYPRLLRSWAGAQAGSAMARMATRSAQRLAEKPLVSLSRGMSVALLGPDGAGKSTLASELASGFCFPGTTAYMGLWQGDDEPARSRWRGWRRVVLRPADSLRRYLAGRIQKQLGRLVVFDRYTYDAYLPPRPPLVRAKRVYFSLLAHTCPGPDLVVLLDAPGEVLAARKDEHTAEELDWQRRHFLRLRERVAGLQVVDAARPKDEVKGEILERIWGQYSARWEEGWR